jgi:hypothetical protein
VATFEGRADGVIESPWWRLEGDPSFLGDGTNWHAVTTPVGCARLRFRPEGRDETVVPFCQRFRNGLSSSAPASVLTWEEALGPSPVRWVDPNGMPRIEIRLDPRLVEWLEAHPDRVSPFYDPDTFHGPESARRVDRLLGHLWRDLDDPFLRLLEAWSAPAPEVTVAYVPDDPARAVPLSLLTGDTVDGESTQWPIWVLAVPFGLFGLAAWWAGWHLVLRHRFRYTVLVVVVTVAALPWLAGPAIALLDKVWDDADLVAAFIGSEMLGLPPQVEIGETERFAGGEPVTVAWTLEMSEYAELLRWIDLEPPPMGSTSDEVLRHLADQVGAQAASLPDEELAALLDWTAEVQMREQGEEIGLLFVDAALAAKGDPERSEGVRDRVDSLFRALAFHPPSDNPYRLAVEERKRILARLPG